MTHVADVDAGTLKKNYDAIRQKIANAAAAVNRDAFSIQLIAVSKGQSATKIQNLYDTTQHQHYGENYAQELIAKQAALHALNLHWHFIGQLQSNKIAKLVSCVSSIQSVASEKHARLIAQHALAANKTPFSIYLLINAANESSKAGLTLTDAVALNKLIQDQFKGVLNVEGIMAIPPPAYDDTSYPIEVPALYKDLQACAKHIGAGKLSLGMSSDLTLAIRAGSTCVRIGTAIFGDRS